MERKDAQIQIHAIWHFSSVKNLYQGNEIHTSTTTLGGAMDRSYINDFLTFRKTNLETMENTFRILDLLTELG